MLPGPALAHHTAVVAAAADKVLAVAGAAAAVVSDGERIGESVQSSQAEGGEEFKGDAVAYRDPREIILI